MPKYIRATSNSESDRLLPKNEKSFPYTVLFILGNEFCERYSYYGMRTILVFYFNYYLLWDSDTSTAVYHAFAVLCYLFPLFGAILADGWWGKYKTILWLSVVYALGMVINTLGAINDIGSVKVHATLSCIGLLVIAIGTGGIKPCVSAFGGDQFDSDQVIARARFFSLFYFAVNGGSLISTFVSPLIREHVQCFGGDCYALAFGIPAILMIVALMLFLFGSHWYKRLPPTGNIFLQVSRVSWKAIKTRWRTHRVNRTKAHWLDYALTNDNRILIRDIKYVLNVLVLFIPLPLFWTLFDQQGSRWTLQAVNMNGYVGLTRILPDQMQICNPLLIITLIPITETLLYPCLRKLKIDFTPLQRMTTGMILACLSFIVAALVQMKIDVNFTPIPQSGDQMSLRVINVANCPLAISSNIYPNWHTEVESNSEKLIAGGFFLKPGEASLTKSDFVHPGTYNISFGCNNTKPQTITKLLGGNKAFDLIISEKAEGSLKYLLVNHKTKKSDDGNAIIGVVNTLSQQVILHSKEEKNIASNSKVYPEQIVRGNYRLKFTVGRQNISRNISVDTGGLYTFVVKDLSPGNSTLIPSNIQLSNFTDCNPNDVSLFWMIPQYFLITFGEIFLSITGLSFSYSQAPPSMKSVLTSFWLLTISIGNIIVLAVAEARLIPKQSDEYFFFAGLIGVAVIIFVVLALRYHYVDESEFLENEDNTEENELILSTHYDHENYQESE